MEPDATYKYLLSSAFMVEELMRWLVAERHGLHALVEALDLSTVTRVHEQSVTGGGEALRRHANDMVWRVRLRERGGDAEPEASGTWRADPRFVGDGYVLLDSHRVEPEDLPRDNAAALLAGLENPLPSALPELVGAWCRRLRAPELRGLREMMLSWAGWRG